MKSMTSYAYTENIINQTTVSVEIKSYNSRYLDLSINTPFWLGRLESKLREFASSRIQRGKVELTVRVREQSSNITVLADPSAARAYAQAIREVADSIGSQELIPLELVIAQEGVLTSERVIDINHYWKIIEPSVIAAFKDFEAFREREGKTLTTDIENMIFRIEEAVSSILAYEPQMEEIFRDNIKKRFTEVLGNAVDEQRVLQETAALLIKYTIHEELVRLGAHLAALRYEVKNNPAPGRKCDFICQEINREINTIGSKNQIIEVGQSVITAKDALENIREQMRNIE
ncbi:MAG TPA: YicC family protein [Treponema sp.]|nr:YicC family protein [Treponema sp.]